MTLRQQRVFKDLSENVRKPIGKAMLDAGYSLQTSKAPQRLTNSHAWKQVMQQYLPDDKLFRKHEEALDATKLHGTDSDFVEIPDHAIRLKAVEMAYRLKGRDSTNVSNTQINITYDGQGYIPPDNVLGLKPTLKQDKH